MSGACMYLMAVGVFSVLVTTTGAQRGDSCLDEVASGDQCCTPSAFITLSFTLHLNSVVGSCDPPSYLDQGVRLEVRRPGGNWEPVRFYTPTTSTSTNSLVTLVPGSSTHVEVEGTQFPVYENNDSEPLRVTEYLCGVGYYAEGTEYRWLQRYTGTAREGEETWSLSDVAITYSNDDTQCSARLTRAVFQNPYSSETTGASWTAPLCEQDAADQLAVYFSGTSMVDGTAQRSVVVTPDWRTAACSSRPLGGCALSAGCQASVIGDHMCSVGSGLQCQCLSPRVAEGNRCLTGVTVEIHPTVVREGNSVTVIVHEQPQLHSDINIEYSTVEVTAEGGNTARDDFTSIALTLSREMGFMEFMLQPITTKNNRLNRLYEGTEIFLVQVLVTDRFNASNVILNSTTTIFIIDADGQEVTVGFTESSYSSTEAEAVRVCVAVQSGELGTDITLYLDSRSGSALEASDYERLSTDVTLSPTNPEQCVSVEVVDDSAVEQTESLTVSLSLPAGGLSSVQLTPNTATILITDNDEVTLGFTESSYSSTEAEAVEVCVAVLSGELGTDITLHLDSRSGTALEGSDYERLSTDVTLSPNNPERCVSVEVVDDSAVEQTESLTVSLSLPAGGLSSVQLTPNTATILITDNDEVTLGFTESSYSSTEAEAVQVCVTVLSGELGTDITLHLDSRSGTALEASDYERLSTDVTLSPTNPEQCVSVEVVDDSAVEQTESLTVSLSLPVGGLSSVQLTPNTATILITDNDVVDVGFVQSQYVASELNMSVVVCVEVRQGQLGTPVSLSLTTLSRTAHAEEDYIDVSSEVMVLPGLGRACAIVIQIVDDSAIEETESLTVSLSLPAGGLSSVQLTPNTATILITDNDGVTVGFTTAIYSLAETAEAVEVCVAVLSGELGTDITIHLDSRSGTALVGVDYRGVSTEVTLSPSNPEQCVSVEVVDDSAVELVESLTVSLSLPAGELSSVQLTQHTATILITDNDVLTVGFTESSYSSTEAEAVLVCVAVLSGELGTDITLHLDALSGTALEGSDYERLSTDVTLFPSNPERCVSVEVVDDSAVELDESLTVSLSLPAGELSSVQLTQHTATILITDNDGVTVGFTESRYSSTEAEAVEVCVTVLGGGLGTDLTLHVDSLSESAEEGVDYRGVSADVTLSPTNPEQCVSVEVVDDSAVELDESLTVSLSLPAGGLSSVQLTPNTATILITDNDEVIVGFTESSYSSTEAEAVEVCVTVLSGELGTDITIHLDSRSGTALEGVDYRGVTADVTLSPTNPERCVSVEVVDDSAVEQTESLTVSLSLPPGGLSSVQLTPNTTTILITDNDMIAIGLKNSSYSSTEAEAVLVCVAVLSGELGTNITLHLDSHSGTAQEGVDYRGVSIDVTLSPSNPEQCVSVEVVDDLAFELNESLTMSLSLLAGGLSSVQLSDILNTATIFITNNDEIKIGFKSINYSSSESQAEAVQVCVAVLDGELGTNITLHLDSHSDTAQEGVDYRGVSTDVTLSPSNPEQCVSVEVIDDSAVELDEFLTMSLSLPAGELSSLQLTQKETTITATDDDVALIGLEETSYRVGGREGEEEVEVCVVTNSTLERNVVLTLTTTTTGAAAANKPEKNGSDSDDNVIQFTVVLAPGENRSCIVLDLAALNITSASLFTLASEDGDMSVMVTIPEATIELESYEKALNEISDLLSSNGAVDVADVVSKLEGLVDNLIESGQPASPEFTDIFIGVVGQVVSITNEAVQTEGDRMRREVSGEEDHAGTSLLVTLDKFALRSFNASLGEIDKDSIKLQVKHVGKEEEEEVTGITGSSGGESIVIPTEILPAVDMPVTVASYYLKNMTGLLSNTLPGVNDTELVTSVLSSALGCGNTSCAVMNTFLPIRITLRHRTILEESERARCVYFDLKRSEWSEEGCVVNEALSSAETTVCDCNHLTHFAVMLSPKDSVKEKDAYAMQMIGYVGTSISLVCLFLTIFIFGCFKSLWSMRNYIHIHLCINLFISQLIFIAGVDKSGNEILCQSIAVVLHYSFLVTFMWMLMEGVVLYVALVRVFVTKPHLYIITFTVVSYGAPLLYMAVVVPLGFLLSDDPHYGGDICWLKSSTNFVWAFVAPVILIILANIGFFIMAIYIIWKQQYRRKLNNSQVHKAKHWLKVSVSLLLIMGITWIVGVLTFHEALIFVSYIFTIFIAFQGSLIFILFVILSKQVRLTLKKSLVRNIISKSDFLSDHLSDFTRSTTGYSQSYSQSNSRTVEKSTISRGIQLGTFQRPPELEKVDLGAMENATVSPSPSASMPSSSSPLPSIPSPTPPTPEPPNSEKEDSSQPASDPSTFTVIFIPSDQDSGRGSPEPDSPPLDSTTQLESITTTHEPAASSHHD